MLKGLDPAAADGDELPALDRRPDPLPEIRVALFDLTGRLPLTATNQMSMAYAILNTTPPPPSSLRPNLPEVLDTITMKAMAKDRASRYQNCIEFGKDLTQAFASIMLPADNPKKHWP